MSMSRSSTLSRHQNLFTRSRFLVSARCHFRCAGKSIRRSSRLRLASGFRQERFIFLRVHSGFFLFVSRVCDVCAPRSMNRNKLRARTKVMKISRLCPRLRFFFRLGFSKKNFEKKRKPLVASTPKSFSRARDSCM